MDVQSVQIFPPSQQAVTFTRMDELKRTFVKLTDDAKRKMTYLSVEAGADSLEEFGGKLLTETIERLWQNFDPKKPKPAKPPKR